jgi:hypothetical protein
MRGSTTTLELEITLTNGTVVTAEVSDWKWKRGGLGVELTWSTPENARRRLVSVDVNEIAAIVEVRGR